MASTSLSLGSHWEKYIQTKIRSGRYGSVSEVVREALRAMEDHDKKLNALRGHLAQGESDAKNGKFVKDSSLKGLLGRSKWKRGSVHIGSIARYTEELLGINQRDKSLGELYERIQALAKNCYDGRHRPEIKEGYYSFNQGKHVIFYMITEQTIDIIGVPHSVMDLESYFGM